MLDAHIVKQRRDFAVDVSIRVAPGASLAIFGASGSGKSTVLSCIAGIEEPDAGSVRIADVTLFPPSLPLHVRSVGYMTQETNLFPHLTVAENVRFAVDRDPNDRAWVDELRDRLGLAALWDAPAARISGGQARRVALARMLARRPALVLLDEPFTGLDRHIVRDLIEDVAKWQARLQFVTVVVDHHVEVLERLCERVVVLEDGAIVQDDSWAALRAAPATPLLARLIAPL